MKRNLMIIALIALCLSAYNCGGGGAGPSNVPAGENSAVPSVLQMQPVQYVAQTGSYIYLKAKVLDGNGMPVPNVHVTFKDVSTTLGFATLGKAPAKVIGRPVAPTASTVTTSTDSLGVASTTLYSTTTGFFTIQASVESTTASGSTAAQLLTKKTVYYSDYTLTCKDSTGTYIYGEGCTQSTTGGTTTTVTPYIELKVDGNNDGWYNGTGDQALFENNDPADNTVNVLATVYDGKGGYLKNTKVTFAADSTVVSFPNGTTATTDNNGHALVLAKVTPTTITAENTVVNLTASTTGGAVGLVSLYLSPVTIASVSIAATPTTVATNGTATVTATVKTSLGTAAPDGTSVSFTSVCGVASTVSTGTITPFAQTTAGAATATFKAPSTNNLSCTVSASSGGVTASAIISVYTAAPEVTVKPDDLKILPATISVAILTISQTFQFTITGGYTPYITTSTDPGKAYNAATNTARWDGSPITVTVPGNAASGTVDLNAYDSKGTTVKATMTILRAGSSGTTLSINPAPLAMKASTSVTAYIIGGSGGPYQVVVSGGATTVTNAVCSPTTASSVIACPAGVTSFTVTAPAVATTATITVIDSVTGVSATSAVTVTL